MHTTVRRRPGVGEAGFTLIELLVVMMIIGVLAAIAIPVYSGVATTSRQAALKSDAVTFNKALAGFYVDSPTRASMSCAPANSNCHVITWADVAVTLSGNGKIVSTALSRTTDDGPWCLIMGTGTPTDGYIVITSQGLSPLTYTVPTVCNAA